MIQFRENFNDNFTFAIKSLTQAQYFSEKGLLNILDADIYLTKVR